MTSFDQVSFKRKRQELFSVTRKVSEEKKAKNRIHFITKYVNYIEVQEMLPR